MAKPKPDNIFKRFNANYRYYNDNILSKIFKLC